MRIHVHTVHLCVEARTYSTNGTVTLIQKVPDTKQVKLVCSFVNDRNVFFALPTGFGKITATPNYSFCCG